MHSNILFFTICIYKYTVGQCCRTCAKKNFYLYILDATGIHQTRIIDLWLLVFFLQIFYICTGVCSCWMGTFSKKRGRKNTKINLYIRNVLCASYYDWTSGVVQGSWFIQLHLIHLTFQINGDDYFTCFNMIKKVLNEYDSKPKTPVTQRSISKISNSTRKITHNYFPVFNTIKEEEIQNYEAF